jgi:multidrug efflux pump subunit AcrA (membrane-fusion protein)
VEKFHVEPSQEVCEGQPLFSFNDTALRNEFRVASEELSVAEASLRKARQGGFHDADQRSRIALMSAGRDISAARRDYARELLDRIQVVAGRDGVAVFDDPNDWIGRPVQTGERIMLIADPHDTELHIDLPVKDAMILSSGARVLLYLDVDPVNAVQARLERVSYEAAPSVNKILSYRTVAQFIGPPESRPRLGLHGVAKIVGDKVPLGMYLFRRPFSIVRQRLGLW